MPTGLERVAAKLCCEPSSEERSAGNPHATFCGSWWRVTATGDPVGAAVTLLPYPTLMSPRRTPASPTHFHAIDPAAAMYGSRGWNDDRPSWRRDDDGPLRRDGNMCSWSGHRTVRPNASGTPHAPCTGDRLRIGNH
jgi:hypothetical protein